MRIDFTKWFFPQLHHDLEALQEQLSGIQASGHAERVATAQNLAMALDRLMAETASIRDRLMAETASIQASGHSERMATAQNLEKALDSLKEIVVQKVDSFAGETSKEFSQLESVCKDFAANLFKNQIRSRWQIIDALDSILYPPDFPTVCPICKHTAPRSGYETKTSECIFGGGVLERYVCPECGCIFGPLKMMALKESQLGEEYKQSYSVYSESNTTILENAAFEALSPRKDGIYLNYGAGAWNNTSEELRKSGWNVYDFEPYAPIKETPWNIRSFEELEGRKFDGIFSNDVIEHLYNPIEDLISMKKLLNPNGKMVHCSGCYEYAFEHTRFHLFFLTGKSLQYLSSQAGLSYSLSERLFKYSPARLCVFSMKN